jgi:hypothetical protein
MAHDKGDAVRRPSHAPSVALMRQSTSGDEAIAVQEIMGVEYNRRLMSDAPTWSGAHHQHFLSGRFSSCPRMGKQLVTGVTHHR